MKRTFRRAPACRGCRVIPVTPLSFQPGVVTTGVEVGDDASGQLNLETLDHHSASWGPGFSSGSESRSSEARGGESSMPQDAWEIKKSSKRRCSISWRSRTVRWGSDGFLKKCESRTCSSEVGISRTASKGIPGAMTRFPEELRSSSGRALRGNTSRHAGLGLELCSISRSGSRP